MSTLAEVLAEHVFTLRGRCACGWQMPSQQTLLKSGSSPRKQVSQHLAAVVAEWLTSEQAAEVAARAYYIASEDDREWAAGAWDDMGGSEPTYERAAAVIAMREALAALAAHAKGEADE